MSEEIPLSDLDDRICSIEERMHALWEAMVDLDNDVVRIDAYVEELLDADRGLRMLLDNWFIKALLWLPSRKSSSHDAT